jgi:hypothetical protein
MIGKKKDIDMRENSPGRRGRMDNRIKERSEAEINVRHDQEYEVTLARRETFVQIRNEMGFSFLENPTRGVIQVNGEQLRRASLKMKLARKFSQLFVCVAVVAPWCYLITATRHGTLPSGLPSKPVGRHSS